MLNERCRVKETGQVGVINAVLHDAQGNPWQVHVKLEGEVSDPWKPPLVLAVSDIVLLDPSRNN